MQIGGVRSSSMECICAHVSTAKSSSVNTATTRARTAELAHHRQRHGSSVALHDVIVSPSSVL